MTDCAHQWIEDDRHENDDRIRTREHCIRCRAVCYGCYAKRLGQPEHECLRTEFGEPLGCWGPVGIWTYSVEEKDAQA